MKAKGFKVFQNDSQKYNLNIIGVRSKDLDSNTFNDRIYVLWKYQGLWSIKEFRATTDPGLYWRENLINTLGTAVLCEGQHLGLWKIGLHRGKYEALVQKSPVQVYRDRNQDKVLDLDPNSISEGLYGINCHRANSAWESQQVDKWSAGCQVIANPQKYDDFMYLCKRGAENWGNSFTYTLLKEEWF
jgi:hypothetical protein